MVEKRVTHRSRVVKTGTIEFGGGALECTVRNLSKTGAALDVKSPVSIPDQFALVLTTSGLHFACRVMWRGKNRIGVKFN